MTSQITQVASGVGSKEVMKDLRYSNTSVSSHLFKGFYPDDLGFPPTSKTTQGPFDLTYGDANEIVTKSTQKNRPRKLFLVYPKLPNFFREEKFVWN